MPLLHDKDIECSHKLVIIVLYSLQMSLLHDKDIECAHKLVIIVLYSLQMSALFLLMCPTEQHTSIL